MDKKRKLFLLDLLGVFFLAWGIIAVANSFNNGNPTQVLYMCYLGLILIGIGILTKKSSIIMSQVYILAIPLLVWDIDFLYWLIFHQPLFGITNYFFLNPSFTIGKIISLQHLFTVPIAFYSAKIIGVKKKDAWKWSFIQIIVVFVLVVLFSNPKGHQKFQLLRQMRQLLRFQECLSGLLRFHQYIEAPQPDKPLHI